jgi:predicted nucleotidyltransferase
MNAYLHKGFIATGSLIANRVKSSIVKRISKALMKMKKMNPIMKLTNNKRRKWNRVDHSLIVMNLRLKGK